MILGQPVFSRVCFNNVAFNAAAGRVRGIVISHELEVFCLYLLMGTITLCDEHPGPGDWEADRLKQDISPKHRPGVLPRAAARGVVKRHRHLGKAVVAAPGPLSPN